MLPLLLSTGHYVLKQNVGVKQTKKLCLYWANDIFASLKAAVAECYITLVNMIDCVL